MRTSIEVIPFYRERRHKRTMEQESLAGQTELKDYFNYSEEFDPGSG